MKSLKLVRVVVSFGLLCSLIPQTVSAQAELEGTDMMGAALPRILPQAREKDPELTAYDVDIRTAYQFLAEGNLQEGYRHLNLALRRNPNRPEAYLGFAKAARSKKQFATAERALRSALEVAPESADVREELARLLLVKQVPTEALAEIDYAILIDGGENFRTLGVRAETLITLDRLEEAAELYPTIIDLMDERISEVRQAISREESKGEITEMYTDTELRVVGPGAVQEVEVTRVETTAKDAPEEWYRLLDKLKADLAKAKDRLSEIREALETS